MKKGHDEFEICTHPACVEVKTSITQMIREQISGYQGSTYKSSDEYSAVVVATDRRVIEFKLNPENLKPENALKIQKSLMTNLINAENKSDADFTNKGKDLAQKVRNIVSSIKEKYGDEFDDESIPDFQEDFNSSLN